MARRDKPIPPGEGPQPPDEWENIDMSEAGKAPKKKKSKSRKAVMQNGTREEEAAQGREALLNPAQNTQAAGDTRAATSPPAPPACPPDEIPEELEFIGPKAAAAFRALRPKQQDFLLQYLRTGNAAEAYRRAYNKLASDHTASALGSQVMASNGISEVLDEFKDQKLRALFVASNTFFAMCEATKAEWVQDKDGVWTNVGDVPDWAARRDGANGLCKVHGNYAPDQVKLLGKVKHNHTGTVTHEINTEPLKDLLNGAAGPT